MPEKPTLKECCRKILEENGALIADKARTILLNDPELKTLKSPLEFISKNWRDPLTPAMMSLSCCAVMGKRKETDEAAIAMSLMNLSFRTWDDIIDESASKVFKPTLFGKFGANTALIIGGLVSAKAFTILSQMSMEKAKRQLVTELIWNLWTKMAQAEIINLKLKREKTYSSKNKLWKIKTEASANLETCLRIGAIIGNGHENEIQHLGKYGLCLGILLELQHDFHVSINSTLELTERIRNGVLPYSLLLARESSEGTRKTLDRLVNKDTIEPHEVEQIVRDVLETNTLDKIEKTLRSLTKKAEVELNGLTASNAVVALRSFVKAQPQLLMESLPTLQAN